MPKPLVKAQAAWRTIGGKKCYFRSKMEANVARYLEWLKTIRNIIDWEHEPETFWFEKIKRGVRSYLPDFMVAQASGVVYYEVKGYMDAKSKTKIKRMAKYYPKVKLIVIDSDQYKSIAKISKVLVPGWE